MTELIIDGIQAVLPKDFTIQVKRENPLITKNGEYTYEITLQLTNPTNAELYKHLNRLNNLQEVATKRPAILIADNRVYCNGTEIITGWTDDTVSIQIASGNSELNYFIGSSLQIEFLKMKTTLVGEADRLPSVEKKYPESDYCLAPVLDGTTGLVYNEWCIKQYDYGSDYLTMNVPCPIAPQPYLCAYIKELLRAIGYRLEVNELEDTIYKDVFLCHTEQTGDWAKMFPGWSVKDFLQQVEALFNVIFLVDNRHRTAKLLLRGGYFSGNKGVHVQQVEDVYEAETEEPDVEDAAFSNISYKVEDNEFWRWNILPEAILKGAKTANIPATVPNTIEGISQWFRIEENQKTDTLFIHPADGSKYVFVRMYSFENRTEPIYRIVDRFAGIERDENRNTIECEMVPATMQPGILHYYDDMNNRDWDWPIDMPTIAGTEAVGAEEPKSIEEMIVSGSSGTIRTNEKKNICIAFFAGIQPLKEAEWFEIAYPLSYIDEYTRMYINRQTEYWMYYHTNSVGASLRPATFEPLLYQAGYDIDYTKAIKVRSHDPNVYAANLVFEIRNKRYVCKEIEYTIDVDGRKGAWTGTFYPIRISDTEADLRWILADGKWRDGGVWLDNGRWLDE